MQLEACLCKAIDKLNKKENKSLTNSTTFNTCNVTFAVCILKCNKCRQMRVNAYKYLLILTFKHTIKDKFPFTTTPCSKQTKQINKENNLDHSSVTIVF